jgi:hypothetical protein
MNRPAAQNTPRQAKDGERTGARCPVCDDAVLRQETFSSNGSYSGNRLVCSRRGCPWQGHER